MWKMFLLCIANSKISEVFCLASYFLTCFRVAWSNIMFSQERKKNVFKKGTLITYFLTFWLVFYCNSQTKKEPEQSKPQQHFLSCIWLVFVRSWDLFRLTSLLKRSWFLAIASWWFDWFSPPRNPATDERDKRDPPGPWGSAPGWHELLPLPSIFPPCNVQPLGSPSFGTPATWLHASLPSSTPHTLDFWPLFPLYFLPQFTSLLQAPPSAQALQLWGHKQGRRIGNFFSTEWFPCHSHIPAFLPCSSHSLCGEHCSRWRMSPKISSYDNSNRAKQGRWCVHRIFRL